MGNTKLLQAINYPEKGERLSILDYFPPKVMLCPVCKEELIIIGRRRMETLDEHVSDPNQKTPYKNAYGCINDGCEAHDKIFWSYNGELYSYKGVYYKELKNMAFIDGNDAPFNTFQRSWNAKKKHEENYKYVFENLLGFISLKVVPQCEADDYGNIVSEKRVYYWYAKRDGYRWSLGSGFRGFLKLLFGKYGGKQKLW